MPDLRLPIERHLLTAIGLLIGSVASDNAWANERLKTAYGQHLGLPLARDECPYMPTLSGAIDDLGSTSRMDLAIAEPTVWVSHKLDIDAVEDQCIAEVLIRSRVLNRGCEFSLLFRSDGVNPGLRLKHAEFEADSFCPGWLDDREGTYTWTDGQAAPELMVNPARVSDRVAERSCTSLQLNVNGDIRMKSGFKSSTFRLDNVIITGKFDSVGDTDAVCPAEKPEPVAPVVVAKPSPPAETKGRFDAKFVGIIGFSGGSYSFEQLGLREGFFSLESDTGRGDGFSSTMRFIPNNIGAEIGYTRLMVQPSGTGFSGDDDYAFGEIPAAIIYRINSMDGFRPGLRAGVNLVNPPRFDTKDSNYDGYNIDSWLIPLSSVGIESDFRIGNNGYARAWIDLRFQLVDYAEFSGGFESSYSFGNAFFLNAALQSRTRVITYYDNSIASLELYEQLLQYRFELGYYY